MSGETASEIEKLQVEAAVPITSGRVVSPTSSAKSNQYGVSLDSEGTISIGEGFINDLAAAITLHRLNKRCNAISAGEARRLSEYITGPPLSASQAARAVNNRD